jgi:hypothetical protein
MSREVSSGEDGTSTMPSLAHLFKASSKKLQPASYKALQECHLLVLNMNNFTSLSSALEVSDVVFVYAITHDLNLKNVEIRAEHPSL